MTLRVYLQDRLCGFLYTTADRGVAFRYDEGYVSSRTAQPLSISLPLQKDEFSQKECLPYFSGLLPEGEVKRQISSYLHVSESSTVKLLEALGGECAGTVSFNSEEDPPLQLKKKYELDDKNYAPISDRKIAGLIDEMESNPLIFARRGFRLSLAGAQQKIALAFFDGKWYVPKGNAPSTHIIKPSRKDFPDIAQNEYLSMQIANIFLKENSGMEVLDFCGKKAFCIKRFDRIQSGNSIKRVHQEDMCQALGIMDDRKYQADGGPSIKDLFDLLTKKSSRPLVDLDKFLRSIIFQFLIGNCDAHGKNFSLLEDTGFIILSPSYDIVSTTAYPTLTRKLAMKIGNEYEIDKISRRHFTELAEKIGVRVSVMNNIFDDFENSIPEVQAFLKNDRIAVGNTGLADRIWSEFLERWSGCR